MKSGALTFPDAQPSSGEKKILGKPPGNLDRNCELDRRFPLLIHGERHTHRFVPGNHPPGGNRQHQACPVASSSITTNKLIKCIVFVQKSSIVRPDVCRTYRP